MYESFNKLDKPKQQSIINACIVEFASKGYTKASTDCITKNAGISKGLLFYYFGNKKDLFLYIVEYVCKLVIQEIIDSIQKIECDDFFDRVKELSLIKIKTYSKYNNEYRLLARAVSETSEELKSEIEKIYLKYYKELNYQSKKHVYNYLDSSTLKPGISKDKALEFVNLIFEQLTQKYLKLYVGKTDELINNPSPLFDEIDSYINFIKFGIYL